MSILRQLLLTLALVGIAAAAAVTYVPAARAWLAGPLSRIGIVLAVDAPEDAPEARRGGKGTTVVAASPGTGAMGGKVEAIGTGQALRSVLVMPEVSGQVTALPLDAGAVVKVGDVLARLDDREASIAVDRAQLMLDDARVTDDRTKSLQSRGAASELQVQNADLTLKSAELELRQAAFDLSQREVRAPIAGTIGIVGVEVGAQVTSDTELMRIDDRSSLNVEFRVPERYAARIRVGDPVAARPLAATASLTGRVSAIDNRIDETSRTLIVRAAFANADDRLRAGMAFNVTMSFPGDPKPAVDPLAIQWSSDGSYVWVVRDGKAAKVAVRILQRGGDAVLVDADFVAGDLVVREGVQTLRPGDPVKVADDADAPAEVAITPERSSKS